MHSKYDAENVVLLFHQLCSAIAMISLNNTDVLKLVVNRLEGEASRSTCEDADALMLMIQIVKLYE
jgi:hypothetical protein